MAHRWASVDRVVVGQNVADCTGSRASTRSRTARSAILADLHDEWQAPDRRYFSEDSMSLLLPRAR